MSRKELILEKLESIEAQVEMSFGNFQEAHSDAVDTVSQTEKPWERFEAITSKTMLLRSSLQDLHNVSLDQKQAVMAIETGGLLDDPEMVEGMRAGEDDAHYGQANANRIISREVFWPFNEGSGNLKPVPEGFTSPGGRELNPQYDGYFEKRLPTGEKIYVVLDRTHAEY